MTDLTLEQRYLEATKRLRARVELLEGMARWKEDLAHRLWRSHTVLEETGEALEDVAALEREVLLFREIATAITRRKLQQGKITRGLASEDL